MKSAVIILTVVSGLLILFTLICGFWIRSQEVIEPSSVSFHMGLALLTVTVTFATLLMAVSRMSSVV